MTAGSAQFLLDLGYRPCLGRDAFLVAPSNAAAVAWIDHWPTWPVSALALAGSPGSGKSHLAAVWRQRSGASEIAGASVTMARVAEILDLGRDLVIEEPEAADEEAMLHLLNAMTERGGYMLLVAGLPPAHWKVDLPDLASRLRALPLAEIAAPDDALFCAVLAKLFSDRQLALPPDVTAYLLSRLERSFAAARRIAAALDAAALAEHRPITVPLAREVLHRMAAQADAD
jgi:chromosomal replication initiation ATPase DnaA